LHPPVDGDVIDLDPPFDEELFDIATREAVLRGPR